MSRGGLERTGPPVRGHDGRLTFRSRREKRAAAGTGEQHPGEGNETFGGDSIRVGGRTERQCSGLARCDAGLFLASLCRPQHACYHM